MVFRTKKVISNVFLLILFALLLERLYMPDNLVTGAYNKYTSIIALIVIFIYLRWVDKSKLSIHSIIYTGICVLGIFLSFAFLGGDILKSFRYIILILIGVMVGHFKSIDLKFFCRFIVVVSFAFSIENMFEGVNRFSGFLISSPTLFSYCVLIALTYLIFVRKEITDIILIPIGAWIIYETGSRSTLFFLIFLLLIGLIVKPRKYSYHNYIKLFKHLFILGAMAIGLFFLAKGLLDGTFSLRQDANYSTSTRLSFIYVGIDYLNSYPLYYITGAGAGASEEILYELTGKHIPLHFDLLSVLIDFGVFGLIAMILFPLFASRNWSWHGWMLLFLGSIHNLLLFPIGLALAILVTNQLELKNNQTT